jgi:hypothetical protein
LTKSRRTDRSDEGGSKQVEHLSARRFVRVGPQFEAERAQRVFGEQHDHLTVEKIRWLAITAAEFVRA